ncbi:unnamed protein product [Staurois parvus]|uniref:Uncharacterized protein n=1 Tax=Staurois parvus TaxID=386267 RepID=A0ABN9EJZ5_9NEOB|nr:unnamed protein product [Staurois parvus]
MVCCIGSVTAWDRSVQVFSLYNSVVARGGLTIWKLGHCPRAWGQ